MNEVESLPPVIQILLDEKLPSFRNRHEAESYLEKLRPELRQQAEGTTAEFYVAEEDLCAAGTFGIIPSGNLNPVEGPCIGIECSIAAAEYFARTVALYADVVIIPDFMTTLFLDAEKINNDPLFHFIRRVSILQVLEPLIRNGVVQFRKPSMGFCDGCYKKFEQRIEIALKDIFLQVGPELTFELEGEVLSVRQGKLSEPPSSLLCGLTPDMRTKLETGTGVDDLGKEIFCDHLRSRLVTTFLDMNEAVNTRSSLFSASRLDMLSLNALDNGSSPILKDLDKWEQTRSIELPWIRNLSPQEILTLRAEAHRALPRLREKVRQIVTTPTPSASDAIAELRYEALEVEAEIKAINQSRGAHFRNVSGILGITMAVYGFAADLIQPGTALISLSTLLGLLHTSARKDEQDLERQQSRPGYVLLKARELVQHADQHDHK